MEQLQPLGDIWQCLEILSIVLLWEEGGCALTSAGQKPEMWATHPAMPRTALTAKIYPVRIVHDAEAEARRSVWLPSISSVGAIREADRAAILGPPQRIHMGISVNTLPTVSN